MCDFKTFYSIWWYLSQAFKKRASISFTSQRTPGSYARIQGRIYISIYKLSTFNSFLILVDP